MCGAPPQPRCSETPPVLRMTDISFESRAGGVAASMVQLDSARDPDAGKPLLPPGAVPNKDATSAVVMGGVEAPTPTAATDTVKKKKGGLLGTLKAMGFTATVRSGRERRKAGPPDGMFMYGDPPVLETYYRNIRDTQLYRVFANSPWNTGRSMWPRVALVVEDAAQGGANSITPYTKGGDELRNRCWRLSARLWTGPAASRDIPSFNWCLTEMHYDVLPDPGGGRAVHPDSAGGNGPMGHDTQGEHVGQKHRSGADHGAESAVLASDALSLPRRAGCRVHHAWQHPAGDGIRIRCP